MKKTKRILALLGVIFLIGLYVSTLVFALIDHSAAQGLLRASLALTIILPVLFYGMSLMYRLTRNDEDEDDSTLSD